MLTVFYLLAQSVDIDSHTLLVISFPIHKVPQCPPPTYHRRKNTDPAANVRLAPGATPRLKRLSVNIQTLLSGRLRYLRIFLISKAILIHRFSSSRCMVSINHNTACMARLIKQILRKRRQVSKIILSISTVMVSINSKEGRRRHRQMDSVGIGTIMQNRMDISEPWMSHWEVKVDI